MNWKRLALASAAALVATLGPAVAAYTEVWRTGGFAMPESVAFDPTGAAFYVSNINSPDMAPNGQGYISKVGRDGAVITERFVEGLNAPKGIDIDVTGRRLWVAGVQELTEVDLEAGTVAHVYAAPGAGFLNDVAVAPDGRVFVSETATGAVWVLENGSFAEWLRDPALAGANGLAVTDGKLLVAPLGDISRGFANLAPQRVRIVDLATKAVSDWPGAPVGALDGMEVLADGSLILSDNPAGTVVKVSAAGVAEVLATPGSGAADLEYVAEDDLIVVPMLQGGEIVGLRNP